MNSTLILSPSFVLILGKEKKKINFFHINYHVLQIPGIRK